ncbi:MAG: 50S ribosomal protein L32 [Planctomycetota bacterium]
MANPKRRISRARRGNRRAHQALTRAQLVKCSHCGSAIRPHTVCPDCGHYRGRQVTLAAKD